MPNQDWSLPISQLLRDGTIKAHQQVENSQGAAWLTGGQLDRLEYARFLMMLYQIYSALESGLDAHSTNEALQPIYQPTMLARAPHLAADIAYFLHTTDWQAHPIFLELQVSTPTPLSDYVSRIRNLSASDTSAPLLLAHAYVRYLGDLSGGQFIKRRLVKVYDLPETGEGVRFYEFESASGDGSKASRPEMKQVKDWYRSGMDSGVGEDEKLKAALVEEAVHVFQLNQALFTAIRGPVQQPLSPITDAPPSPNTLVSPVSAHQPLSTSKSTRPLSSFSIASLPPTVRPWVIMAVSVGFTIWWFGSWSPYLNPQLMHTRGPSVA